jgi:hypothetical protein
VSHGRRGAGFVAAGLVAASLLAGCGAIRDNEHPVCAFGGPTVLMAEAVPTASMVPCVHALPLGWRFGSFQARDGGATFTLDSDVAGKGALQVELSASCGTGGATRTKSDEAGATMYVAPPSDGTSGAVRSNSVLTARWFYRFPGGCTEYVFALPASRAPALQAQIRSGASFVSRQSLDRTMREDDGRGLDIPEDQG